MPKQDPPARRLPTLDLLKGFDAAARHLSFTRAGEELFLTQSALSRQIQALEKAHALLQEEHELLKKAIRFCSARKGTPSPSSTRNARSSV